MSKKINRAGIMALENLENAVDAAPVEGQPVAGTKLEGGKQDEGTVGDGKEVVVASTTTPEASGSVAATEPVSSVADGDAIVFIEASVKEVDIDDGVLALEEAVADIDATMDQIDEAADIVDTMDGMNDALAGTCEAPAVAPEAPVDGGEPAEGTPPPVEGEAARRVVDELAPVPEDNPIPEDAEGLTPAAADALRIVTEHFQKRLGDTNTKRVFPAMENFGGKKTKAEGARMALAHNRKFALEARRAVNIAQEGLFDKIKNGWDLFWTNESKLLGRFHEVSGAYDKGTPTDQPITKPAWGKALNINHKPNVTGADVVTVLGMLDKGLDSDKLAAAMTKGAGYLTQITASLRKSTFVANDEATAGISALQGEMDELASSVTEEFPAVAKGKDADFEPLKPEDKAKVAKLVETLLTNKKLKQAFDQLEAAYVGFAREYYDGAQTRLRGAYAADMKAAENASRMIGDMGYKGLMLMKTNVRVCHATLAYMAASVRKGAAPAAE